jgi:hypothetical protein
LSRFLSETGIDQLVREVIDFREIGLVAEASLQPLEDDRRASEVKVMFSVAGGSGSLRLGSLRSLKIAPVHGYRMDDDIFRIADVFADGAEECAAHLYSVRDVLDQEISAVGEFPTGVLLLTWLEIGKAFRGHGIGLAMMRMLMRVFAGQALLVAGNAAPNREIVGSATLRGLKAFPRLLDKRYALTRHFLSDPVLKFVVRDEEHPEYVSALWTGWEVEEDADAFENGPTVAVDPRRLSRDALCELLGDDLGQEIYEICRKAE